MEIELYINELIHQRIIETGRDCSVIIINDQTFKTLTLVLTERIMIPEHFINNPVYRGYKIIRTKDVGLNEIKVY